MSVTIARCRYCDSTDLATTLCAAGPQYARTHCRRCNRFLGYEPEPPTFDRARKTVLRLGKYAGRTIEDVASDLDGCLYLGWLRHQPWLSPALAAALECYRREIARRRRAARLAPGGPAREHCP